MNYIINESQEHIIINTLLKEELDLGEKRLLIKKYLDDNFKKGNIDITKDGEPSKEGVVLRLTSDKKPFKTMTDKQLFYHLQNKYKDILPENERDEFLKDLIKKWYYNKISKNGNSMI